MKPLEGLTVLDMTHVLAGPYCAYQLGLLGADVTKIESPKGDMTRIWGGTEKQINQRLGSGFLAQNAGKKSVVLDLGTEQGAGIARRLASNVDIFVENYRPGVLARSGLDYDSVKATNPTVIYLSITAFGSNGPHGHRPGFDDVVQATSGYMSINERGDGPIRTGGPVLDYATGMHATSAVLGAALVRERTGQGSRIDLAMQDVAMLLINRHVAHTATTQEMFPPAGNRDDFLHGRFATKDGYIMLAGYLPRHQKSILRALGLNEYAGLSGSQLRSRAQEIGEAAVSVIKQKTSEEWDAIFSEQQTVAGAVRDLAEVLATGQPQARSLLTSVDSDIGEVQVTTAGYLVDEEPLRPDGPLRSLGADTVAVLQANGYSQEEIDAFRSAGAIGSAP
ncbi:MAG: CoA transferase [Pseudomonadota bacterium]